MAKAVQYNAVSDMNYDICTNYIVIYSVIAEKCGKSR